MVCPVLGVTLIAHQRLLILQCNISIYKLFICVTFGSKRDAVGFRLSSGVLKWVELILLNRV